MKKLLVQIPLGLVAYGALAQGTLVYDQQSFTNDITPGVISSIGPQQSIGQSFSPTISSVDFFRLYFSDQTSAGSGATVMVNLWSGSISNGTLIASTDPVFIPHGFFNYTNLLFSAPVSVTPGDTYYLQPFILTGDSDQNMTTGLVPGTRYLNGTVILMGASSSAFDLLFREGIVVVPEPSIISLVLLGTAGIYFQRRKN